MNALKFFLLTFQLIACALAKDEPVGKLNIPQFKFISIGSISYICKQLRLSYATLAKIDIMDTA